jgi:hypothetical protein
MTDGSRPLTDWTPYRWFPWLEWRKMHFSYMDGAEGIWEAQWTQRRRKQEVAVFKWFKSKFGWRTVGEKGAWRYLENKFTGQRRAVYLGGYSPLDDEWLDNHNLPLHRDVKPSPPTTGSGVLHPHLRHP